MNIKDAKRRINKLQKLINYYREIYHNRTIEINIKNEISTEALDSLKKELFDLESKYPSLITANSPTQRIAGSPLKAFKKVKHYKKMYSLNDAFDENDLKDWEKKMKRYFEKEKLWTYFCELKVDGLAIELIYENGNLLKGSTRGDGLIGDDVTQNLKMINSIPLTINNKSSVLVVYGEVFILAIEFEKINRDQKKNNLPCYSNSRNLAAGSLRQLDPSITKKRNLSFMAYDVAGSRDFKTHQDKHLFLKKLGFLGQDDRACQDLNEVFAFYKKINQNRKKSKYDIDGIVVLVNEQNIFEKLGATGKASRGCIAYKFPLKEATTKLKDIIIQIGRTGALTPVAELEPVLIDGVTISRATLYNQNEIERLGLKIGDTVIVGRAGDVIPKIIKTLPELRDNSEKEILMPSICPYCDSLLNKKGEEELLYCLNQKCFNQVKRRLHHFASKKCFDIGGCGPKIIDKLLEANLISDGGDFYDLKIGDLINLEGFSNLSSKNLIKAIKKSKKISFYKFIFALGINGVGEQTALSLSKEFSQIKSLSSANIEKIKRIKDIGPIVALSISFWFKNLHNKIFLNKILKKIQIQYPEIKLNKNFKDKKFLFTGSLSLPREEAKETILKAGGIVVSVVTKDLNYLIIGENPGSKLEKAKKSSIIILDEDQFLSLFYSQYGKKQ